jgi:SAM-dependent methyltransferase
VAAHARQCEGRAEDTVCLSCPPGNVTDDAEYKRTFIAEAINKYALCDPNPKSIAWAQEHLPGIHAFVSPAAPPLPLDAKSLDLIYAVSIWSHYAERLALLWLKEMHRLLKPKGLLYITTHGKHLHACAFRCLLHVS